MDIQVARLEKRLAGRQMEIIVDEGVKDFLARVGYDSDFGARPLKRAIRRHIEDALSVMLIQDRFGRGSRIRVSFDEKEEKVVFAEDTAKSEGAAARA